MEVTSETVAYLEKLAYLRLDESQRSQLQSDLNKILAFAEQLGSLSLPDTTPMTHAGQQVNVLRADQVCPGLSRPEALRNAPASDGQYYLVPKVLD